MNVTLDFKLNITMSTGSQMQIKKSTKVALTGLLSVILVCAAGIIFNLFGVNFGPEQAGLTGVAGVIGSLKLLAGG